jgi:hypothetical protein
MAGRIIEAGYAYSKSAILLYNIWDFVILKGSSDASLVI